MKRIGLIIILVFSINLFGEIKTKLREYDFEDWMTIKNCNIITSISEGVNFIYLGTNGGIIPYHKYELYEEPAHTTSDGLADDLITAVYYDNSTQYLWAGHRKGISYLCPTDEAWTNLTLIRNPSVGVVRIGSFNGNIVVELSDNSFVTLNSLVGFEISRNTEASPSVHWSTQASINPVAVNGIYTTNFGYWVRDDGIVQDNTLREFPWNIKYVDQLNNLYGGILGLGYIVGDERMQTFNIYQTGILKNFVNSFVLTDNYLWVASEDNVKFGLRDRNGISRYDFGSGEWDYFEDELIHELATGIINEIDVENNILLAATNDGLSLYEIKNERWRRYSVHDQLWSDAVNTVAIDSNYAVVGTEYGLNILDLVNKHMSKIRLSNRENLVKVFRVAHDENQFWIGTDNGIFSLNPTVEASLKHYDFQGRETALDNGIALNCYSIKSDGTRTIFYGNNFFMMHDQSTGKWTDLPHFYDTAFIYDMDIDGDWLWLGTNEGAKLLNINTSEWEEYHFGDGLAGEKVMKVEIDGDWVWFGTDQGLTKYNWRKYVLE